MVGVSTTAGNYTILIGIYLLGSVAGWVAPLLTPKIGQRGVAVLGFGVVFVSLLVCAAALYTGATYVLPFGAVAMAMGQYTAASNVMTIPTVVAKPEYRGTASGFSYLFSKGGAFLAIFLFPSIFTAIGQANSTALVAVFPLIALVAAIFLLPEIYGYEHD
jgi:MFS family permease